ncbi:MAG: heme-binding protein [Acidobacteria bacterium]|nr:heme-binding protein [Acidobacteriota bacterium]
MRTLRILGTLFTVAALAHTAELTTKKALNLEVSKQMAAAAEAEARKNKWNVVICLVDDGANLIYLQKMDETQIGSIEVALEKAKTAVRFKRPTKAFEDAVAGGRQVVLKLPGALPVEGGIPIMADGKLIGAIGVSGVQSNQDAQIAQAAIDALAKILGR